MNQRQKTKKKLETSTVLSFIKKMNLPENVCFVYLMEMIKSEDELKVKSDVVVGIKFLDEWMGINKQMKIIKKKLESVFRDKIILFVWPNQSSELEKNKCEEMIETMGKKIKSMPNNFIFYVPNK